MRPFDPRPTSPNRPLVVAHRGISSKAPENTLAAFELALQTSGIDMVELDVRLSNDGEVIVLHDRTLQRTSTGNGVARKYSYDEIQQFDAGSWFHPSFSRERIPTLTQVLQCMKEKRWVDIELKSDQFHKEPVGLLERNVLDVVHSCGMERHVMYSSFDHALVANVKRLDPSAHTGVLHNYLDFGKAPSHLGRQAHAEIFVCGKKQLNKHVIEDAHQAGLAVFVYTVNLVEETRRAIMLGVDAIISDSADEIVTLLPPREP